ncbi:hypothetical protein C8R45DRAFT_88947 [Mycena sanguinolenta]|nr:hypothetical protein C8R45DRAFT_88947 [Mycena sanguinolenta]
MAAQTAIYLGLLGEHLPSSAPGSSTPIRSISFAHAHNIRRKACPGAERLWSLPGTYRAIIPPHINPSSVPTSCCLAVPKFLHSTPVMPTSASTLIPMQTAVKYTDGQRPVATLLRDLCSTVALCYLITLALVRLIALHLDFRTSASCGMAGGAEHHTYERVLDNISHLDVLKVTTACSVVAFVVLELGVLLARRAGLACATCDIECPVYHNTVQPVSVSPAYPPEKQYFEIAP